MASPAVYPRELVEHLGSAGYVLPSMAACALASAPLSCSNSDASMPCSCPMDGASILPKSKEILSMKVVVLGKGKRDDIPAPHLVALGERSLRHAKFPITGGAG